MYSNFSKVPIEIFLRETFRNYVKSCPTRPKNLIGVAMNTKTCNEAFQLGQAHSLINKRTQGAYKLAERLRQWKECEMEVNRIAGVVTSQASRYDLQHCTYEDKHVWLRRILKYIAYELSADIIPSFKALIGDGMSGADIKRHLPQVMKLCRYTLQVLESAQQSIKGPIQDEYDRMRGGQSVVGDALATARQTLEAIINLTPPEIKKYI